MATTPFAAIRLHSQYRGRGGRNTTFRCGQQRQELILHSRMPCNAADRDGDATSFSDTGSRTSSSIQHHACQCIDAIASSSKGQYDHHIDERQVETPYREANGSHNRPPSSTRCSFALHGRERCGTTISPLFSELLLTSGFVERRRQSSSRKSMMASNSGHSSHTSWERQETNRADITSTSAAATS
jgi:hypothetical protein